MKAIFIYDTKIREENNVLFTTGTINFDTINRYLRYCEEIKILSRREYREKIILRTKIYDERIKFRELPNLISKQYLKNRMKLVEILTEEIKKADLIIIRLPSDTGRIAAEICNKLNKKFITEFVGCPFDSVKKEFYGLGYVVGTVWKHKTKKIMKKCDDTIYVTEQFLQQRYPNRCRSIGCSDVIIDNSFNVDCEKRLKLISSIHRNSEINIGLIGNYHRKYKGVDIAIKAVYELTKKGFNVTLNILGEGNNTSYIKLAKKLNVREKINFCGVLSSGNEVLKWLDKISIYIQPSYQEGMPRALVEAMSRGCPVATSNAGGMPEVVNEEFLHKPGDYKQLAKIIEYMILNNKVMVKQSKENLEKSKQFNRNVLDNKRNEFIKEFYVTIS